MTNSLKTLTIIAISTGLLSTVACKENEVAVPFEKDQTTQQPAPATDSPAAPAPQSIPQQPSPAIPAPGPGPSAPVQPSVPGQLRRIKWAPLDYKEFEYNAQGNLTRYYTQYNSVQGSGIVSADEVIYSYDATGKVVSSTRKNGIRTEYTYSGDVWSEALSYDKLNRPLRKYQFTFNGKKQLTEYTDYNVALNGTVTPRSKTNLTYDASGNLTRYRYFWYVENSRSFVLSTELQYSNFDTKNYPKNADSFSDHILQPLTFFVNNPGKKEILSSYSPVEYYSYTYDSSGYPTRKRTSYTYDKPLPAIEASLEY